MGNDSDEGQGGSFGTNGFQMMGIMNALKTGDVQTDMIIAMCIPFILRMLFGWVGKVEDFLDWEGWVEWWTGRINELEHERFISYSTTRNSWGYTSSIDSDSHNSILFKAIKLYLHKVVRLNLKSAYLDLMEGEFDSGSDDDDDRSRRTLVGILSRYKIINSVPSNEWHNLGMFGNPQSPLKMRIEQNTNDGDKDDNKSSKIQTITIHFRSPGEGAIDAFIDSAYEWYLGELRKLEDHSRYLYEMKVPEISITTVGDGNNNGGGSSCTTYKRFKLSNEKTFDSLFFREKESLLGLVDHFGGKSGKYAIKGYPHKLGIMLHGPPGTGKTSLIKALAQYTGRSIVNVPLSGVSTNSELMSIFFDRKYRVEGSYVDVRLGFKDVIFVMEDVDAASQVVKRRDGRKSADILELQKIHLPVPKSLWRMFLESTSNDCKDVVKELVKKSERLKAEAEKLKPEVLNAIAQRLTGLPALGLVGGEDLAIERICDEAMKSLNARTGQHSKLDGILSTHAQSIKASMESGTEIDEIFVNELLGDAQNPLLATTVPSKVSATQDTTDSQSTPNAGLLDMDGLGAKPKPFSLWGKLNPDQLSLSGLLNVLDGVVDSPGRILIMTTNHPEMLDPALIRPGRIDKKIMLGYMAAPDIVGMLEHYFQTSLGSAQIVRVERIVNGDGAARPRLNLTPAQVEQLAVEHDRLDDLIYAMEEMGEDFNQSWVKIA